MIYTAQEIFDTVKAHLLAQNQKAEAAVAVDPSDPDSPTQTRCLYRTPAGLKCAVGCLIPDELYSSKFEANSVSRLVCGDFMHSEPLFPAKLVEAFKPHMRLLVALQSIHDFTNPIDWPTSLAQVAIEYKLCDAPAGPA